MRMSSSKVLLAAFCLSALFLLCSSTYVVQDNGVICLLLDLTATIRVTYNSTNGTKIVPREAQVKVVGQDVDSVFGECVDEAGLLHEDKSVQLNMTLPDGSTLNVTFYKATVEDKGVNITYTYIDRVIYEYDTTNNPNYISPVHRGKFTVTDDYMGYMLSHSGNFYSCSEEIVLSLSPETQLVIQFVKVQIIDVENNTYSDVGDECEFKKTTTTTPVTTLSTTVSSTTGTANSTTVSTTTISSTSTSTTTLSPNTTTVSPNTTTVSPNTTTVSPNTTTMSPITTTVSPNTTTMSPITTTVSPNTTTVSPNTTTVSPNTTTTNTTPHSTTSIIPTPTGKPSPNATYFVVDEKTKNICLLLKFTAINFTIAYNQSDKKLGHATVPFNPVPTQTTGQCQDKSQQITFTWRPKTMPVTIADNWVLTLEFDTVTPKKLKSRLQADSESAYALKKVSLTYVVDDKTFPNPDTWPVVKSLSSTDDDSRFQTPVGQAYHCDAQKTVSLKGDDFQMSTQDFETEAFRHSNTTTFDNKDLRCSEDESPHNPVVPIVVGIVLMLLVIIVLVAYFIIRRQRTKNAYEQI